MDKFEPADVPLVIDAMFAMTTFTYAMVLKDDFDMEKGITDAFTKRFIDQGFDPIQSGRVAATLNDTIIKMIKDFKEAGL